MKSLHQGKSQGRGDHRIGCIFRRWPEEQHPAGACSKYAGQQTLLGPFPQSPKTQIAAAPAPASICRTSTARALRLMCSKSQNHREIARCDIHVHPSVIGGSRIEPALILLQDVGWSLKNK